MQQHLQFLKTLNRKQKVVEKLFHRFKELAVDNQLLSLPINREQVKSLLPLTNQRLVKQRVNQSLIGNKLQSATSQGGCSRTEKFQRQVVLRDLVLQGPFRKGMELPITLKVILNTTSKRFVANKRELTVGLAALLAISGQRVFPTTARKSIAGFKLREGVPLGCKVTLRGQRGYSMLDKVVTFVLPRGHFSHVKGRIDRAGNWEIGVADPLLFAELEGQYDLFRSLNGIDVSIAIDKAPRPITLLLASGLQLLA